MSLRLSDHKVLHNIASSSSFFAISLGFSRFFFFLRNLKQLLHSPWLDIRLVIANSALRASLAI